MKAMLVTASVVAGHRRTPQARAVPKLLDSNWQVCSQNIRPGDPITTTTKIEFAAVKLEERCP